MNTIYDGSFVLGNTNELTFSAGPGIKIDQPSEGTVRIANDETVLAESSTGFGANNIQLSEAYTNFEKIRFEYRPWSEAETPCYQISEFGTKYPNFTLGSYWNNGTNRAIFIYQYLGNNTTIEFVRGAYNNIANSTAWNNANGIAVFKVVGINRISGGNE